MRFDVAMSIKNRWGTFSRYDLREIATVLVDRFSLTNAELEKIVTLRPGQTFQNEDLRIRRCK